MIDKCPFFCISIAMVLLISGRTAPARAGRLEDIETEIRSSSSTHDWSSSSAYSCRDYDDLGFLDLLFQTRCYQPYPYYFTESSLDPPEKQFSVSGGFNYLYDTRGDLDGYQGELIVGTPIGKIGGDFTRFRENLKPGHDYLNLYYIDYRFGFDLPGFTLDLGGGYAGLTGDHSYGGASFFLATQIWPLNPLGIDLMLRGSSINNTSVGDYRIGVSLAYHWGGIRIGYRYLNFENSPDIHGPEFGVRFWL